MTYQEERAASIARRAARIAAVIEAAREELAHDKRRISLANVARITRRSGDAQALRLTRQALRAFWRQA